MYLGIKSLIVVKILNNVIWSNSIQLIFQTTIEQGLLMKKNDKYLLKI